MVMKTQVIKEEMMDTQGTTCNYEHFSADELRLLQNMLNTDRKTIDYIEGVLSGLDMTERRATAGVLVLKVRRMLDRLLSDEMEARKAALEAQQKRAEAPPEAPAATPALRLVGEPPREQLDPTPEPGPEVSPTPPEAIPAEPITPIVPVPPEAPAEAPAEG